jgi:RNA polymerase sigma-70 factor, ECF subfamily
MEVAAFKKLVLTISDKLYRYAFSLLNDSEEAKDILQETYLRLWKMRDKLAEYERPEALAMTIVRNLSIDRIRKLKPMVAWEEKNIPGMEIDPTNSTDMVDIRDSYQRVLEIMGNLPAKQKEVIYLREVEGYSTEEIMGMMEINANDLRVTLSRARTFIRDQYKLNNETVIESKRDQAAAR